LDNVASATIRVKSGIATTSPASTEDWGYKKDLLTRCHTGQGAVNRVSGRRLLNPLFPRHSGLKAFK
jgi:hypothetical protein